MRECTGQQQQQPPQPRTVYARDLSQGTVYTVHYDERLWMRTDEGCMLLTDLAAGMHYGAAFPSMLGTVVAATFPDACITRGREVLP